MIPHVPSPSDPSDPAYAPPSESPTAVFLRLNQTIVRHARDSILITEAEPIDPPGPKIVFVNPALLELTGYRLEEVIGRTPRMFQGPRTDRTALDRIRAALQSWQPIREELINYRKDGSEFWIELDITPLADDTGRYTHWLGIQRDITQRKQAELALREREQAFRVLAEQCPDPVFVLDPADSSVPLKILFVNEAVTVTHGFSSAELLGRSILSLDDADSIERAPDRQARILAGETLTFEVYHRHRDGHFIPFEVRATRIDWNGRPAILSIDRNLTERRQAEEARRQSELRFKALADNAPAMIWVTDSADRCTFISEGWCEYTGLETEAALGFGWPAAVHPEDRLSTEAMVHAAVANREPFVMDYRLRRFDGVYRWVIDTGRPQFDEKGEFVGYIGSVIDVHERKEMEDALRASEERLSAVINNTPNVAIQWYDEAGRVLLWNDASAAMFGFTEEEALDKTLDLLIHTPAETEAFHALLNEIGRTGKPIVGLEFTYRHRSGRAGVCLSSIFPIRGKQGRTWFVCMDVDITERKRAAEALALSEERYRLLADHIDDVVTLHDADGRYLYVSPSSERLTGWTAEELLHANIAPWVHPEDLPAVYAAHEANRRGERTYLEWRTRHKNGSYLWVETAAKPILNPDGSLQAIIASTRDITRRRRLEEQVRQAQKLDAIGRLAGGVAHDFNNLLTVINGCCELLLADLPPEDPKVRLLRDMRQAGERGAALTRQLLAFGRQQMMCVEVFHPIKNVRDSLRLLSRLLGEDVVIDDRLDPNAGAIRADPGQFEQVVMNLAINARDAMPRGGRLTISVMPATLPENRPLPTPEARPGNYVRLSVADTGVGMTAEVRARLFEPFFTTKQLGKGTGLGLATVYGIVRQLHGFIIVESEIDQGTTFHVYFPRHEESLEPMVRSHQRPTSDEPGNATILVVEDDESVRLLTKTLLARQGYQVVTAESGEAALALCETSRTPPDLVLVDVVMPGMNGRELAEKLAERYPRLKVVFLSGYTADAVMRYGVAHEGVAFLQKPYTPDALVRFVHRVLSE